MGSPKVWWSGFVVVQSLGVQLFVTPWATVHQVSLSFTISKSLLKLMSIRSVMPSNHLIFCHPRLLLPSVFPSTRSFPMSWLFTPGGQSTGASASVSALPVMTFIKFNSLSEYLPLILSCDFQHPSWAKLLTCLFYFFSHTLCPVGF